MFLETQVYSLSTRIFWKFCGDPVIPFQFEKKKRNAHIWLNHSSIFRICYYTVILIIFIFQRKKSKEENKKNTNSNLFLREHTVLNYLESYKFWKTEEKTLLHHAWSK